MEKMVMIQKRCYAVLCLSDKVRMMETSRN